MNKRGTTLIELLVVLTVLAVLLSVSVPAIASLTSPKQQLRKKARAVNRLLQTARLTAIKQNRPIEVVIDAAGNRLIARESGYTPLTDSFGAEIVDTNRFSQVLILEEIEIAGAETNDQQIAVSFTPFGSSNGGAIHFEKDGASLVLACDVLTGRPFVQKPERSAE